MNSLYYVSYSWFSSLNPAEADGIFSSNEHVDLMKRQKINKVLQLILRGHEAESSVLLFFRLKHLD